MNIRQARPSNRSAFRPSSCSPSRTRRVQHAISRPRKPPIARLRAIPTSSFAPKPASGSRLCSPTTLEDTVTRQCCFARSSTKSPVPRVSASNSPVCRRCSATCVPPNANCDPRRRPACPPRSNSRSAFYAAALRAQKPFGGSVAIAFAPDSNINRAIRSDFALPLPRIGRERFPERLFLRTQCGGIWCDLHIEA